MADKSHQVVLQGLHKAVGENQGRPLLAGRTTPGLFAGSASGKKAAQFCKDQGLVHTLRTETKRKITREICAITDKGLTYLLAHVTPGEISEALMRALEKFLENWQAANALEDCPLPELYRSARQAYPTLTIGQFHDSLRCLHQREQIFLHPWTGPLYEIPEPTVALLVGHEIAYYASTRR